MDRNQPRHVDRRDHGLRRQRLATGWTAAGSAALAVAFGWTFAQARAATADPAGQPGGVGVGATATPTTGPRAGAGADADEQDGGALRPAAQPPEAAEPDTQPDTRSGGS